MAKLNVKSKPDIRTAQGAKAHSINPEQSLRRSVLAHMLWEENFYYEGESVEKRIYDLIPKVKPDRVRDLAIEAREKFKLRHVPLYLVRRMAELPSHRHHVSETLQAVIQRPDELSEFLAIYWKNGRSPLSAQVKKGLAKAFPKFDEYQLAKWDKPGAIRLKDVLFLCHAKPQTHDQAHVWERLVQGTMKVPDTWEVALSATKGEKKTEAWTRLLTEKKIPAFALIRNLRNLSQAKVNSTLIRESLINANTKRLLPFRFITAAEHAPDFDEELNTLFLKGCQQKPKLQGKTVLIVDVSGSMYGGKISKYSEMDRAKAACSLAALVREQCEDPHIWATAGNDGTRVHATKKVPARRGFALIDAIYKMTGPLGRGGIFLNQVMTCVKLAEEKADRVIVITDEQDCDNNDARSPAKAPLFAKEHYLINVSSQKNGIGYGRWIHLDGFSEAVLDYIKESEVSQ